MEQKQDYGATVTAQTYAEQDLQMELGYAASA